MSDRLFDPAGTLWKVDREMALLLGGGRALLMQLAHPGVASGVAEHSRFRDEPLARLRRTMNTMWSIVFDEQARARISLQRVKEVHRRVRGAVGPGEGLPEGTSYDALDADLLLWVHATLVDSALITYQLFVRPLSAEEKARYYDETRKLALLFDVPEKKVPASLEAFDRYVKGVIEGAEISVGPAAAALAREILHPRPLVLKATGPLSAFITIGLLPPRLREAYGLEWDERHEKWLLRLAGVVRRLLPLVPPPLRIVPQARAAERRSRPEPP